MIKVRILGCGSSGGVPRVGGNWGVCDPLEPKNRRSRCSLHVQKGEGDGATHVLVDTSPDLREQFLKAEISRIDGVLYTHDHADQTHGIDDLRIVAYNMRQRVDVYADKATQDTLKQRFGYCFVQPENSPYPPILTLHLMPEAGRIISIDGPGGVIEAIPFHQEHGNTPSLGFRFGDLAYSSDVVGLSEESFDLLQGLETWVVDALRYDPHPTHAHLDLVLEWVERLKPKHVVLTNLHVDMDYQTLRQKLPPHIEPAYDGMVLSA